MEIIWTEQALQGLQQALDGLAPMLAEKLAWRIVETEEALLQFPQMGKSLAYLGYPNDHKLLIRPYVLHYSLEGETNFILSFRQIADP